MVLLSSLVHINFLLTGCCTAISEAQQREFDPNKKTKLYWQLVWNEHVGIDFPPKSTFITECNVNLTDLLKDITGLIPQS